MGALGVRDTAWNNVLDLVLEPRRHRRRTGERHRPSEEHRGLSRRRVGGGGGAARCPDAQGAGRRRAFSGRTARVFYVGEITPEQAAELVNLLEVAAAQSRPAHEADDLRAIIRYNRIPSEKAAEFWERAFELTNEYSQIRREGDMSYAFVACLYPTVCPRLPDPN